MPAQGCAHHSSLCINLLPSRSARTLWERDLIEEELNNLMAAFDGVATVRVELPGLSPRLQKWQAQL